MAIRVTVSLAAMLVLAALPASSQTSEPWSLKGFALGQAMTECPAETTAVEKSNDGAVTCKLGPTTLANHPATEHAVMFADGKVVGVGVWLPERGFGANSGIRDALIAKFGKPWDEKPHINEAEWRRDAAKLYFDGFRGQVALVDTDASRRRAAAAAKANKKDL